MLTPAGAPGPVPTRSVSLRRAFLLPAAGGVHGQVPAAGVRGSPALRVTRVSRGSLGCAEVGSFGRRGRSVRIVAYCDSSGTWWVAPPKVVEILIWSRSPVPTLWPQCRSRTVPSPWLGRAGQGPAWQPTAAVLYRFVGMNNLFVMSSS